MESNIWKHLPTDMIRKIIEDSDPSIDVQLAFKIRPKKLDEAKSWRLWYMLKSHDGIIYNLETKTLHSFRFPGFHIIRRNIELSYHTAGLWIFNEAEKDYTFEIVSPCGCFSGRQASDTWVTNLRVLLRGSQVGFEGIYGTL
jgi:hypothetical protein